MGSAELFRKRKGNKKERKENIKKMAPYRYLIVCEGEKTEPNYFQGIKRRINNSYSDRIKVKERLDIDIKGIGKNTGNLVSFVETLLDEVGRMESQGVVPYGHVWIIFDKDDFPDDQFNNAIDRAEARGYHAGWSNESMELWFLLHFEFLNSGIRRNQYVEKLNEYFKRNNINKGKYEKNMSGIFDVLVQHGDVNKAIERSRDLYSRHMQQGTKSKAKMKPANTVYQLIEELGQYF
jgi:hypothetical protein